MIDLKRIEGESEDSYIYRVCAEKDNIGNWFDVARVINYELGYNYGESKYRKMYQSFNRMFDAKRDEFCTADGQLDEIRKATDELRRERQRLFDQRREYNKIVAHEARFDNLADKMYQAATKLSVEIPFQPFDHTDAGGEKEAVLFISDIHYGMTYEGIWNKYNTEIAKQRIARLVAKTKQYCVFNGVGKIHVVLLGDSAHGAIHTSARVKSEEDACDQLMHIAEILAEAIHSINEVVPKVDVYSTYGNHMRTVQNKKESVHSDNMEKIIPWWLKWRLKDFAGIKIIDSEFYEFIKLNVLGTNIVATHGDLDGIKNMGMVINTIFSRVYGCQIDMVVSGDKHHIEEFECLGIDGVIVGSLCGTDECANSKRLYSNPSQSLMIFSREDGRQCTYNIKL